MRGLTDKQSHLRDSLHGCIPAHMKPVFDMDDRARLNERFFGATRAVLARLS